MEYLEDISKTLYYSTGLPVNILDENNTSIYTYGGTTSIIDSFEDTFNSLPNFIYKTQAKSINGVSAYTCIYGFSFITAVIANENKYYGSLLLGPVLLEQPSEHIINEILKKTNLPLTKRSVVKNAIESIPVISNARNYYLCKVINNLLACQLNVSLDSIENPLTPVDFEEVPSFEHLSEFNNHNYGLERLFCSKVSSGDIESVKNLFKDQIKAHYFINLGTDQLRPVKNNGIIFTTLLARAAITGGVEPDIALSLADYYNNKIEDIFRYNELISLIEQYCVAFTEYVLQTSEVNHVSVVKKVSKYIHSHLSEPIRLNDVADHVNLSPNYFSSLFKREMGVAFADYLNEIRIKESQYLLETTNYSIVDIAIAVGFNNQNYFTTIFRKHTGTTPKQFRMKSSMK
jgi:AraC-like DNA-binding protein